MHGATVKNIRRTGVPATIKGAPNPEYTRSVFDGPTAERIAKAQGSFTIGDDKQGTRVYQFHDTTVDRLYSRLAKRAKGRTAEEHLRSEYIALQRYRHHWQRAGLESGVGSVDLNRLFSSDISTRAGMPMSEKQVHHGQIWREARELLGHKPGIVVENVMCAETSLEIAGWSIGAFTSRTSARDGAEKILRECGRRLAKHWGI